MIKTDYSEGFVMAGAVLPGRLKVARLEGGVFVVVSPEALKGQRFTEEQLDFFFRDYEVIPLPQREVVVAGA